MDHDITQDLNALFKEVYAKKIENLVPEGVQLLKDVRFAEGEKIGDSFHQPLRVEEEASFSISTDDSAFALRPPIVARYVTAVMKPAMIALQSQISYAQALKALNKKQAVETAAYEVMESMKLSLERRLEEMLFYGGKPRTALQTTRGAGVPADNSERIYIGNTNHNRTINKASATAFNIDFTNVLGSDKEITNEITGAKVVIRANTVFGRAGDGISIGAKVVEFIVTGVDSTKKKLQFTPNAATTVTSDGGNIQIKRSDYISVPESSAIAAFLGTQGFEGLDVQLSRTTGNNAGVPVTDASGLLKGSTYAAGGALTVAKVAAAAEVAVPHGLEGMVNLYINIGAFANLLSELDKNIQGFDGLQVPYSRGVVNIKPSLYVNLADGFLVKPENLKRIGTSDVTFKTPGLEEQGPFHRMQENHGFIIRGWTQQALLVKKPAQCVKITGITASDDS